MIVEMVNHCITEIFLCNTACTPAQMLRNEEIGRRSVTQEGRDDLPVDVRRSLMAWTSRLPTIVSTCLSMLSLSGSSGPPKDSPVL